MTKIVTYGVLGMLILGFLFVLSQTTGTETLSVLGGVGKLLVVFLVVAGLVGLAGSRRR